MGRRSRAGRDARDRRAGGLREPYASLAKLAAERRNAMTVAVDLPSGIDADTGAVAGAAVRADVTVTFGAVKPGLLIDPGAGHAGVVEFVDIGLGPYLGGLPAARAPQAADIAALLPRPGRGVRQVPAGRRRTAGRQRPLHRRGAACHRGRDPRRRGMVRLVTLPRRRPAVRHAHPEAVITELGRKRQPVRRSRARGARSSPTGGAGYRHGPQGRAWAPTTRLRGGSRRCSRPACRCSSTRDGLTVLARNTSCYSGPRRRCSPRTRGNSAGCSTRSQRTSRRGALSTRGARRQTRRVRAAQGLDDRGRAPDGLTRCW